MEISSFLKISFPLLWLLMSNFIYDINGELVECIESDRNALLDFKKGLIDPENRLFSWKGSNCCKWRGVGCDNATGAVTAIDLHNPYPYNDFSNKQEFWNLSGEISPSLTRLKSLSYLDLSFNTFKGIQIPGFIGSLKNLQYLNISNTAFGGKVPATLGNISALQYLDMTNLDLIVDNLEWFAGLGSLKYLAMDGSDLSMVESDWMNIFNKLPYLTELHMNYCNLPSPISSPAIVNFTSLSVIDLSNNQFHSELPNWLVNISSLTSFKMRNCSLYGRIPLGFSDLPDLRILDLKWNGLSGSCSQLFRRGWNKIEVLHLGLNKIHGKLPSSIGNMTSLTSFDLRFNSVEGGIPSSIGRLCNLTFFRLAYNHLNGRLPKSLEKSENCITNHPLSNLEVLHLSSNYLVGGLPDWLEHLENLHELDLSFNLFEGPIPDLRLLQKLTYLDLARNNLNGTIPESIGKLSQLSNFSVYDNQLIGTISESYFSNLSKLKFLSLSSNSLRLNVSLNWVPPFQVNYLYMRSCHLGPSFPLWLRSQNELRLLDLSNANISGSIPNWFWKISENLSDLNISFNQLEGQLPNPLNIASLEYVDLSSNLLEGSLPLPTSSDIRILELSNNKFSGHIPKNISKAMPYLNVLSLANNQITGEIPQTNGEMNSLSVINLSRNNLSGNIPTTIGNCSLLEVIDLGKNNLSGPIPTSLGQLNHLQTLHLNENKLTGELPSSFQNLSSLETLILDNNGLVGNIPPWIGTSFPKLRILSLRSNAFSGTVPALSNLTSLQVLDLAQNKLNDFSLIRFSNLKAMLQPQTTKHYLAYGLYMRQYEENYVLNAKGTILRYTKTLSLVISIDLSGNELHGDFPQGITELAGLLVLNLSKNRIRGQIPENISRLNQLLSLDISNNKLSGTIPPSLSALDFLGYLNLSNNNFSGKIPYANHLTTFVASSFAGNPNLCGDPLSVNCQGNYSTNEEKKDEDERSNEFIDNWFYMSVGLGFAAGILVPFCILAVKKSWSYVYFQMVDKVMDRLISF